MITALGYEERFVKTQKIDFDKEREVAAKWLEKQAKLKGNAPPPAKKPNGHGTPSTKRKLHRELKGSHDLGYVTAMSPCIEVRARLQLQPDARAVVQCGDREA